MEKLSEYDSMSSVKFHNNLIHLISALCLGACVSQTELMDFSQDVPDANGPYTDTQASADADIQDARGGDALGTSPKQVAAAPAFAPALARNGTQSFVVWVDKRNSDFDIYGSRILVDGTVLDPGGIPISTQLGNEHSPDLSWTGSHYLVTWMDRRGQGTQIYATRIDEDGTILDPGGFPLSTQGDYSQSPKVSSGTYGSLVVFEGPCGDGCTGVVSVFVDSEGNVGPRSIVSETGRSPSVASDGQSFLVGYSDYRNGPANIYARYLNGESGTPEEEVALGLGQFEQLAPSVAGSDLSGYMVAWVDTTDNQVRHAYRQVGAAAIASQTAWIDSTPRWQDPPQLTHWGEDFFALWTQNEESDSMLNLHFQQLSPAEDNATYSLELRTNLGESSPRTSCSSSGCTLAWSYSDADGPSVLGSHIAENAVPAESKTWATRPQ